MPYHQWSLEHITANYARWKCQKCYKVNTRQWPIPPDNSEECKPGTYCALCNAPILHGDETTFFQNQYYSHQKCANETMLKAAQI